MPEGHVDLTGFTHDLAAWEGEKKERELLMRTRERVQQKLRGGKRGKRDRTKEARSGEADSQRQPRQRTHMHAKGGACNMEGKSQEVSDTPVTVSVASGSPTMAVNEYMVHIASVA